MAKNDKGDTGAGGNPGHPHSTEESTLSKVGETAASIGIESAVAGAIEGSLAAAGTAAGVGLVAAAFVHAGDIMHEGPTHDEGAGGVSGEGKEDAPADPAPDANESGADGGATGDQGTSEPGTSPDHSDGGTDGGADGGMDGGADSGADSDAGGNACFIAGTPIVLADGTTKPIEQVIIGDLVLSRDPDSHTTASRSVTQTMKHSVSATLLLQLENGEQIETTKEHRFFVVNQGFVPAGRVSTQSQLHTQAGALRVVEAGPSLSPAVVYNFTVEEFHTYFVSASGVLVHNEKMTEEGSEESGGVNHNP